MAETAAKFGWTPLPQVEGREEDSWGLLNKAEF